MTSLDKKPSAPPAAEQISVHRSKYETVIDEPGLDRWIAEATTQGYVALDTETADEVMSVVLKLNRENGQTFVFVTHDPRIGAMLDRVINMRDGLIV